ncbi:hypothetical protein YC2023_114703 [Brassica napus]
MSGYCYSCGNQQPPPQLPYSSDGNNPPYGHQPLRCALRRTKAAILIHTTYVFSWVSSPWLKFIERRFSSLDL